MEKILCRLFAVVLTVFVLMGSVTEAVADSKIPQYTMEYNTNRPGEDYQDLDLSEPEPELCASACLNEAGCRAWTYVKPGVQGETAKCWLKERVPPTVPDENCVSGLMLTEGEGTPTPSTQR